MTDVSATPSTPQPARLVLEDGTCFRGRAAGALGSTSGEVVFSTAMTGYQEVLTDPSFHGQIVTLTTAEVGVTGWVPGDNESNGIQVAGFVARRLTHTPSSWRCGARSLPAALAEAGVVAVEGVDTRALTRHLRVRGDMRGVLCSDERASDAELLAEARAAVGVVGQDFTTAVSVPEPWCAEAAELVLETWTPYYDAALVSLRQREDSSAGSAPHIVLADYGAKWSIVRHLLARGCRVTVVPARTSAERILALEPDGVLLSNGPGDPAANTFAVEQIRALLGRVPVGGICMGFQLAALACGAETHKLSFGHRGSNHPVLELATKRTYVTSQNHGFAVRRDSLDRAGLELTHISLHDGTAEGLRHRELPLIAVQFHPEAAPGPHDAHGDFYTSFLGMLERRPDSSDAREGGHAEASASTA